MSKTTFIYALCEPGTRTVRYIGKSKRLKRRFTEHMRDSITHKTHLGNWLRSLNGKKPNLVVLSEVDDILGSEEEIRYISAAKKSLGMNLVNGTDGGDGNNNPSLETREKWRRAITPEQAARIGAFNRGKHLSKRIRDEISAKNKGRKLTPEQGKAGGDARQGFKHPWSSSRFIGVYKGGKKGWYAAITFDRLQHYLGYFLVEEDAARARDIATLKFLGPTAKLNFPIKRRINKKN